MKKISKFDIQDHGIQAADYFQGAGSSGYDAVYTGIGKSAKLAAEDALEQAASDWDVENLILIEELKSLDADEEELDTMEGDMARDELAELLGSLAATGKARWLEHTLENATIADEDVEEYKSQVSGHLHHMVSLRLSGPATAKAESSINEANTRVLELFEKEKELAREIAKPEDRQRYLSQIDKATEVWKQYVADMEKVHDEDEAEGAIMKFRKAWRRLGDWDTAVREFVADQYEEVADSCGCRGLAQEHWG